MTTHAPLTGAPFGPSDGEIKISIMADAVHAALISGSSDPRIGLWIRNVIFTGQLDLRDMDITRALRFEGCVFAQPVLLTGAAMVRLTLHDCTLVALSCEELHASSRIVISGCEFLSDEVTPLAFRDGVIKGSLSITNTVVRNDSGSGVDLTNCAVGGGVVLGKGASVHTRGGHDAVLMIGIEVRSDVDLSGLTVEAAGGDGLRLDRAIVSGELLVDDTNVASFGRSLVVRQSSIGPRLSILRSRLVSTNDIALDADRLVSKGGMYVWDTVISTNSVNDRFYLRSRGALRMIAARIDGGLDMRRMQIEVHDHGAIGLDLRWTRLGWIRWSPRSLDSAVTLNRRASVILDGLIFDEVGEDHDEASLQDWIKFLTVDTPALDNLGQLCTGDRRTAGECLPRYAAQPFRQLASIYAARGDTSAQKRILVAQQRALVASRRHGRLVRWAWRLIDIVTGYGYEVWRTLGALSILLLLSCALTFAAGIADSHSDSQNALLNRDSTRGCSFVEKFGLAIDNTIPFISTKFGESCQYDTSTRPGQLFTVAAMIPQIAGWLLATILVVGVTKYVRSGE